MTVKINHRWDETKARDEIEIISHSANKEMIGQLTSQLQRSTQIHVNDIKTNRIVLIDLADIEVITSLGHVSQVLTSTGEKYFLNKRLKELAPLEKESLVKINQSTILNLKTISQFNVEDYSRLNVMTQSQNSYLVSRHYAKQIKERLSC